jgi:GH24 family phage-related lysozyme (muramidase)
MVEDAKVDKHIGSEHRLTQPEIMNLINQAKSISLGEATEAQKKFAQSVDDKADPDRAMRSRFERPAMPMPTPTPAPAGLTATPQVQEKEEDSMFNFSIDDITKYISNLFSSSAGAPPAPTVEEQEDPPSPPPPPFSQSVDDPDLQVYSEVESTLLPFLRDNEGFISKIDTAVEDKGKQNPTKDIGYGHKLSAEELKNKEVYGIDVSKGISKDQADFILSKDLEKKYEQVSKKIPNFKNLTPLEQALVTDFEFNVRGGIKAFPKMLKALQARDVQTLNKEYKRYMGTREEIRNKSKPLKKRNETTYSTFIAPLTRKYENKAGNLVASNPNPYPARAI